MSEKESNVTNEQKDLELSITRVFDAPREMVFEAWTNPDHLKKWFAPAGFEIPSLDADVKPSGKWHSSLRKPDGTVLKMGGAYREIVPPEKLVLSHAWDPETGGTGHETVITVTFDDVGGKTKMHFHQAFFLDNESRDAHQGGWNQFFDQLEQMLQT